jgi:hypothetical protein
VEYFRSISTCAEWVLENPVRLAAEKFQFGLTRMNARLAGGFCPVRAT